MQSVKSGLRMLGVLVLCYQNHTQIGFFLSLFYLGNKNLIPELTVLKIKMKLLLHGKILKILHIFLTKSNIFILVLFVCRFELFK